MKKFWLATIVLCAISFSAQSQVANAPATQLEKEEISSRQTLRYLPANPRGIIFLFHGSGGSESFATNSTTQRVLERFVSAGYGYASSASLQRTDPKRWNLTSPDPTENPDIAYMLDLHKHLIATGQIKSDTPVFTMGMSNGGGMANLFGLAAKLQGLPVMAVADYMGPFPASMFPIVKRGVAPAPTFVVVAEHDGLVNSANVLAAADGMRGAGSTVESHMAREVALTPVDFTSIEGVDPKASSAIFAALVKNQVINAKGERLLLTDKDTITRGDATDILRELPAGKDRRAILRVLLAVWAGHMMRSDYAEQQFAFFEAALGH